MWIYSNCSLVLHMEDKALHSAHSMKRIEWLDSSLYTVGPCLMYDCGPNKTMTVPWLTQFSLIILCNNITFCVILLWGLQ